MPTNFFVSSLVWVVLALCLNPGIQVAQEISPVKPSQQSVVLFDFRVSRWLQEARAAKLDTSGLAAAYKTGPLKGFTLSQIDRVFGSASLPEDFDSIKDMALSGADPLPFEVFVQIRFVDAQSAEKFEASVRKDSRVVKIAGKEFLKSKGIGPENFVCRRFDENTFEFGTEVYCQQENRVFLSERLKTIYQTVPDHSFRIAIDMVTPKKFVGQAIQMGRKRFNTIVAGAYLNLVQKAESVVFTHSLSEENLLTLFVEGGDEATALEIKEGLESAVGFVKLIGSRSSFGMPPNSESKKVLDELVQSFAAAHEGSLAKIEVPRPKGFFTAVNELIEAVPLRMQRIGQQTRFRQVGLACMNFQAAYQELPFNYNKGVDESLSWRAKILPFVDELKIHEQIDFEADSKGETNSKLVKQMPAWFGKGGELSDIAWVKTDVKQFSDITDGASKTVMLIETPKGRPWLSANPLTVEQAVQAVASLPDGDDLIVVMYDGTVRTINNSIDEENLRFLFDPTDGNELPGFKK